MICGTDESVELCYTISGDKTGMKMGSNNCILERLGIIALIVSVVFIGGLDIAAEMKEMLIYSKGI